MSKFVILHKRKIPYLDLLYNESVQTNIFSEFAALLSVTRSDFNLVTVKNQNYYVYRYEGKLNGIENAVVLLSYPEKAFGKPKGVSQSLCKPSN